MEKNPFNERQACRLENGFPFIVDVVSMLRRLIVNDIIVLLSFFSLFDVARKG